MDNRKISIKLEENRHSQVLEQEKAEQHSTFTP